MKDRGRFAKFFGAVNCAVLVALILAGVMLGTSPASAQGACGTFLYEWGSRCILSTGENCVDPDGAGPLELGDGQFNAQRGIATDGSGNVYVADENNHRIQKFDSSGNFLNKWGSKCNIRFPDANCVDPDGVGPFELGDGQFNLPQDVAVDGAGNVYVSDFINNRIQKFDSSGNFITKWGTPGGLESSLDGHFRRPVYVAADGTGNVYVTDYSFGSLSNHRVQKFDSNGNFLLKWGSFGTGDGQFDAARGVATYGSGIVYVSEVGNNRIQKFDSGGNFLLKWGSFGTGDGQFNLSQDITVDSSGNVYVTEGGNHRIQVFDSNGTFLTKWGSFGSLDGEFNYPIGITSDAAGHIYVSDRLNHRVQKFTCVLEREVSIDIKPGSDPNSINLCSNGAVPLAILGSDTFDVLDVNTETLRFAEAAVKVVGKKSPHYLCSYEDVNGDFIDDVVCHFVTADIAAIDGESTTATLNGELLDGTPIEGTDSVNIVKDTCN